MLLAIDVGNTHTLFALCDARSVLHSWRFSTHPHRTEDELAAMLEALMQKQALTLSAVARVIVSCVVPDLQFAIECFARKYIGAEAQIIGKHMKSLPMPVEIDRPEELGADRLVNAFAAWQQHQRALMVIDFGTATTFDVVDSGGAYVGGVIAPGVNLSLEALTNAAARLHGIPIRQPESVIGKNTTHAMQSGIYFGYMGMVNTIIEQTRREMPQIDYVVATGGLAELYSRGNPMIDCVDGDLTIRGLIEIDRLTQKETNGF